MTSSQVHAFEAELQKLRDVLLRLPKAMTDELTGILEERAAVLDGIEDHRSAMLLRIVATLKV